MASNLDIDTVHLGFIHMFYKKNSIFINC